MNIGMFGVPPQDFESPTRICNQAGDIARPNRPDLSSDLATSDTLCGTYNLKDR